MCGWELARLGLNAPVHTRIPKTSRVRAGGSLWLGLLCGLLACMAHPARLRAETKPEKVYRKILPSVMTLEVENMAGERFVASGVLALADDVAVTAWHVVSDARAVWAVFADGRRMKATGCIDQDGDRDLALIKLEKPLPNRRAVLGNELQPVATRAYAIGSPKGSAFTITEGLVSQILQVDGFPQYQVSCPISPGSSGGPVLNNRGEVIGITSWTKTDAQNMSFAIPVKELARLDPARASTPWAQLTTTNRPPLAARASGLWKPVAATKQNSLGGNDFEDLKARLRRSTGKVVTIVVQEAGHQNKFTFTVPEQGLK